jgi:hypothetical protein
MKRLFQFSIRTLLIAVTLTALTILWIQWPRKTVLAFLERPGDFVNSIPNESSQASNWYIKWIESNRNLMKREDLIAEERSAIDLLWGRQSYTWYTFGLVVCRGQVTVKAKMVFSYPAIR